jgi:hypothetical protein
MPSVIDAAERVYDAIRRYMNGRAASPRDLEILHVAGKAVDEVKRWPKQPRRRSL